MDYKPLKFDKRGEVSLKIAEDKVADGDFFGALSFLRRAAEGGKTNVHDRMADVYMLADRYDLAIESWFKFLNKVSERQAKEVYSDLSLCLFYEGNLEAAGHYFTKKAEDGFGNIEVDEEMIDAAMEYTDNSRAFKIVYPFDRADYSETILKARRAMVGGRFDDAIELLLEVDVNSDLYPQAMGDLSVIYFMQGDHKKAFSVAEEVLKKYPNNVYALCNCASITNYIGDYEKSSWYFKRIKEIKTDNLEEIYKMATTSFEQEDYEFAAKCFEDIEYERPFNGQVLNMCAAVYFNLGDYKRCKDYLLKVASLDQNDYTALYFLEYVDSLITAEIKLKEKKPLDFFHVFPEAERKRRLRTLGNLLMNIDNLDRRLKDEEIQSYLKWCLYSGEETLGEFALGILSVSNGKESKKILTEILLSRKVLSSVKRKAVVALINGGYARKTGVVVDDMFSKIEFNSLEVSDTEYANLFKRGYAEAFAVMVIDKISAFDLLYEAALELYYNYGLSLFMQGEKEESVAELILIKTDLPAYRKRKRVASLFKTEESEIDKLVNSLPKM